MTLTIIEGNIFDSKQPCVGHGVNVLGIMGGGIAVKIRNRWPEIFQPYVNACASGELSPGTCYATPTNDGHVVLNMASQDNPGRNARLNWLETSLREGLQWSEDNGYSGVAIPRIGAGIGGLVWAEALATIEQVAAEFPALDIELWIFPGEM